MLQHIGIGDEPDKLWKHLTKHGNRVIVWKMDSWKDDATVCWGDGQQGVIVFPYSEENVNRIVAMAESDGRGLDEVYSTGAFHGPRNPYLEIQIHRQLTVDDVEGYLYRDPKTGAVRSLAA